MESSVLSNVNDSVTFLGRSWSCTVPKMDCNNDLRSQAQQLIERMKTNQGVLKKSFGFNSLESNSSQIHVPDALAVSDLRTGDAIKAKQILKSKAKSRTPVTHENKTRKRPATTQRLTVKQGTLNIEDMKINKEADNIEIASQNCVQDSNNSAIDRLRTPDSEFKSYKNTTPTSVRKRRDLIDRNVKIDKCLFEGHKGRFIPYSGLSDSDSDTHTSNSTNEITKRRGYLNEAAKATDDKERSFYSNLTDGGNDRREVNFIKETASMYKPKSILNSSGPNGSKRRGNGNSSYSKVSFRDSRKDCDERSSLGDKTSKQLLGYDWIAGLLDNDPTAMNQSETFFDEIVEFRRVNRDDCVHSTCLEDRLSIGEHEPLTVKRALEKKVKPFTINDRLFTVPVNNDWLASYVGERTEDTIENKEPSYDAPRFVRVSIPRSTLMTPHRYKPHRRRSFDPTDSMALGEHCLLGWESSRPASMPTASNIALKDAARGVKTKIATTLEEAEKIAASFYWPDSSPTPGEHTNHRLAKDAILQLRYASLLEKAEGKGDNSRLNGTTGGMPILSATGKDRNLYQSLARETSSNHSSSFDKSSTDKILDTTYSLMYEMQRMKEEMDVKLKHHISVV